MECLHQPGNGERRLGRRPGSWRRNDEAPQMRRASAALAMVLVLGSPADSFSTQASKTSMIDTIDQICAFVSERQGTAVSVAQRFGMHLHDEGSGANITFTPRDRRFTTGSVGRKWESEQMNGFDLAVAPREVLTVAEVRKA